MQSIDDFEFDTTGLTAEALGEVLTESSAASEPPPAPTPSTPAPAPAPSPGSRVRSRTGQDLDRLFVFDFETVPDDTRMHLFPLEGVPDPVPETPDTELPEPDQFMLAHNTQPVLRKAVSQFNPTEGYLLRLIAHEDSTPKPRKGVLEDLRKAIDGKSAVVDAHAKRMKLLSVTPEYCRIVAMGFSWGGRKPDGMVVGGTYRGLPVTEENILEFWWGMAAEARWLCGYNVLDFDIPVALVRSQILGVEPKIVVDRSPYSGKVIDLMQQRFGRHPSGSGAPARLKDYCRVIGIDVPAGETSGGDVLQMYREDPEKLLEYAKSDVQIELELFLRRSGYWHI